MNCHLLAAVEARSPDAVCASLFAFRNLTLSENPVEGQAALEGEILGRFSWRAVCA